MYIFTVDHASKAPTPDTHTHTQAHAMHSHSHSRAHLHLKVEAGKAAHYGTDAAPGHEHCVLACPLL